MTTSLADDSMFASPGPVDTAAIAAACVHAIRDAVGSAGTRLVMTAFVVAIAAAVVREPAGGVAAGGAFLTAALCFLAVLRSSDVVVIGIMHRLPGPAATICLTGAAAVLLGIGLGAALGPAVDTLLVLVLLGFLAYDVLRRWLAMSGDRIDGAAVAHAKVATARSKQGNAWRAAPSAAVALSLVADRHPVIVDTLAVIVSQGWRARYRHEGRAEQLTRAETVIAQAKPFAARHDPIDVLRLDAELAEIALERYLGEDRDVSVLDGAIARAVTIVTTAHVATPEDQRLLAIVHGNLSTYLLWRFGVDNDDTILDRAERHGLRAVELAHDDPDLRAFKFTNVVAARLAAQEAYGVEASAEFFDRLTAETEQHMRASRTDETRAAVRYYLGVLHMHRAIALDADEATSWQRLDDAVTNLEDALSTAPPGVLRHRLLHNLAMAHVAAVDRGEGAATSTTGVDQLRRIRDRLSAAAARPTVDEHESAVLSSALGSVVLAIGDATDDDTRRAEAAGHLRRAVDHSDGLAIEAVMVAADQLGDIEARRGRWREAAEAYAVALDRFEVTYQAQTLPRAQEAMLVTRSRHLAGQLAVALAHAGRGAPPTTADATAERPPAHSAPAAAGTRATAAAHVRRQRYDALAAVVLEQARARQLVATLRQERLRLPGDAMAHDRLRERYEAAVQRLQRLERDLRSVAPPATTAPPAVGGRVAQLDPPSAPADPRGLTPLRAARRDVRDLIVAAHRAVPQQLTVPPVDVLGELRRVDRFDPGDDATFRQLSAAVEQATAGAPGNDHRVADLVGHLAIAATATGGDGWWLSTHVSAAARALNCAIVYLASSLHGGVAVIVHPAGMTVARPLPDADLERLDPPVRYAAAIDHASRRDRVVHQGMPADPDTDDPSDAADDTAGDVPSGSDAGDEIARLIADLRPLVDALRPAVAGVDNLALVACGPFAALPMHAAVVDAVVRAGDTWPLRALHSAPNATALTVAASRADDRPATSATVYDDREGGNAITLAHPESLLVHNRLGGEPPASVNVEKARVLELLAAADVLHVATHASWDPSKPLTSAIALADDEITLADVRDLRLRARLAILSACETARIGDAVPDEVVGFPAVLMQLGVAGVIATGWKIRDEAAFVGVARFLDEWCAGHPPAVALLNMQRWMATTASDEIVGYLGRLLDDVAPLDARIGAVAASTEHGDDWARQVRSWAAFTFTGV